MAVRFPSVADRFYPGDEASCRRQIEECLYGVSDEPLPQPVRGGVVPHAGWAFSGATAGRVFAAIKAQGTPETFVLTGAVHSWGVGRATLYGSGNWRTPLGDLTVDEELAQEVLRSASGMIVDRPELHRGEHSIEVQTPFIRHLFPQAQILPISVPPSADVTAVGRALASAIHQVGRHAVVVGSSDLTHYGPGYGFAEVGVGERGLQWAKQNDQRILELVVQMRTAEIVPEADVHHNACGAGAIASAMACAAELGATRGLVLQHITSHEVLPMGRPIDLVGYAAVAFL